MHARLVALTTIVVLLAGCVGAAPRMRAGDDPTTADVDGPSGALTVFAAASLTDAFTELGRSFEDRNPAVDITFNFAGSSTLATQLVQGAPADVFASADTTQMDDVVESGLAASPPVVVATNRLAIAVEPGNPHRIRGPRDLARTDLIVVLAAPQVPAGAYARQALDALAIDIAPASLEPDVRAVLARVRLGEADAGIVYHSDIVAADGDIEGVGFPVESNVAASYPIVALASASNPSPARAFIGFAASPDGQATLRRFGFAPPWAPRDEPGQPS